MPATAHRALVVEDDEGVSALVQELLRQGGFTVTAVADGASALVAVRDLDPDLVTLDLNLPDLDGIEVCRRIRTISTAYVLMLTARPDEIDRLVGLETGADDYLTKPFSPRELTARVRALMRRPRTPAPAPTDVETTESGVHRLGALVVDLDSRDVHLDGADVPLTRTEFDLLATLLRGPNRVWNRDMLLQAVWGEGYLSDGHLVEAHMGNLRRKLGDDPRTGRYVRTVRGVGYRLGPRLMLEERDRLAAVTRYTDLQPDTLADLTGLCEVTALACDVPNAAVHLIDDRFQRRIASFGVDPGICLRDESMCAITVAGAEDVYLPDASKEARFWENPWVSGLLGRVRFYSAALLWTNDGAPIGTLCIFDDVVRELPESRRNALRLLARQVVDVLELQLRSRRLEASLADVARAQEQLTAFAGQVSHDLKTPLTTMRGFSELLADHPAVRADAVASSHAAHCVGASRRMMDMIDALLAYSRIGAALRVRDVPLEEVMGAVVADLGALASGAEIDWHGSDVRADPVQLRALLQNLVGNSLKYRAPGVPCRVSITAGTVEEASEITVADNGSGIPEGRRADALAPLGRLRTDLPGTGLGLATCARIAAAHGGSLRLGDTPGGGTTVTVRLGP